MEFYHIKLLNLLEEQGKWAAAEYIFRLNHILRTFAYIKRLLYSEEYRGFRFVERLSYHVENFYIRVYFFREGFYLMINEIFGLSINRGDPAFRKQVYDKIKEDKELSFLLPALEKLKNNKTIKKCLEDWRKIEHKSLRAHDLDWNISFREALANRKLSDTEKMKIINTVLKQTDDDIEEVIKILTDFLEEYSKKIYIKLEEHKK